MIRKDRSNTTSTYYTTPAFSFDPSFCLRRPWVKLLLDIVRMIVMMMRWISRTVFSWVITTSSATCVTASTSVVWKKKEIDNFQNGDTYTNVKIWKSRFHEIQNPVVNYFNGLILLFITSMFLIMTIFIQSFIHSMWMNVSYLC